MIIFSFEELEKSGLYSFDSELNQVLWIQVDYFMPVRFDAE